MSRLLAIVVVVGCLGAAAVGCGDNGATFTIYASFGLQGGNPTAQAVQLAFVDAGRRAGQTRLRLVLIATDSPTTLFWEPRRSVQAARRAAHDKRALGYVGDAGSDGVALQAAILNRAGLAQVTPTASYPGLTSRMPDRHDEPSRYRPTGRTTLARIMPSDRLQAAAMIEYLRREGVRAAAIIHDGTIYGAGLAGLMRAERPRPGLRLLTPRRVRFANASSADVRDIARRAAREADALVVTAGVNAAILNQLHHGAPRLRLFLSDSPSELFGYGDVHADTEAAVRLTAPQAGDRSPAATAFARHFRSRFGTEPGPAAYYGYEAMQALLAAIERARSTAPTREAVRRALLGLQRRDTVLGDYEFDRNGDSTIRAYGTYRVRHHKLVFAGAVDVR